MHPVYDPFDHAANDLALYTINTRDLYPDALRIHKALKSRDLAAYVAHPQWVGHAKRGRASYEREMGPSAHIHMAGVAEAAARIIADHYRDHD